MNPEIGDGARFPWAALLAAIAVAAYLPSLAGPFHFDDYNVIVNYPTVHSWSTLFERASGGVRALLKASYVLNWTIDAGPFGFHLVNIALHATNAVLLYFIGRYEGAIGVKTGTTGRAGNCLVAIAERNGVRVVLVLLNAQNRWWNAAGLLDRAFEFHPQL